MQRILFSRLRYLVALALLLFLAGGFAVFGAGNGGADAAPDGATDRLITRDVNGNVSITYFSQAAKTPVGANTPLASNTFCAEPGSTYTKFVAEVELVGTLTGTNPTAAITWQHSYNKGANWVTVGSFTTINATVTPASQVQQVSDVAASTATVYGDCWRALLTFGGTSPGGNIAVYGYMKP